MSTLSEQHRELIRSIGRSHGAEAVRIFGSFARGTATDSSDVDVLVRLTPNRGLLDLVAIKQDIEAALGRGVDVVTEQSLSPYIRQRVLKEAIPA